MKLETFFQKFNLFADAPNAVEKMRDMILHLAIRGNLSEQPISESCEAQLLKADDFAKRSDKQIEEPMQPAFSLPSNWGWVPLGHCMHLVNGKAFKPSDWASEGTPIIRIQNLNNKDAPFNYCGGKAEPKYQVRSGDLLISWSGTPGTSFGAFVWDRGPAVLNQHIFRCELVNGVFQKEYLRLSVNARLDEMISRAHGAVGLRHITKGELESIPLPLPPLAEQKRIVAKVDELMALCDRLEQQQQERETRHTALASASLTRFAEAPTPKNLNFLFHSSFSIQPSDLRKSILTLAVQGKIVPQDGREEPVSPEILKVSPTAGANPALVLPATWRCVRLGQISALINGDRSKNYPNKAEYVAEGVPWINTGHIEPDGTLSIDSMHYITRKKFESLRSGKVRPGDLVYCLRGATLGKTAIITQFNEGAVASSLVIIRLSRVLEPRFVYLFLISPPGRDQIFKYDNGSAQPNLSADSVKKYWMPIPPLAEQRRIVAKVAQLMALVDQLETQLTASRTKAEQLLEALVSELTNSVGTISTSSRSPRIGAGTASSPLVEMRSPARPSSPPAGTISTASQDQLQP